MASSPFLPASVFQNLIPALNQGTVKFSNERSFVADEADYIPDEGSPAQPTLPAELPKSSNWTTAATFKYGVSALVDGAWQRVTVLTVPVPLTNYKIQHQDKVTWTGFEGRVVAARPVGSADLPSAWKVSVA